MIKEERNKRSPLRILEKSIHGGLGKGNIGLIAARKGVGKTACLVHIATDQLFLNKHVIHVSFSGDTSHIISWYEDIFREIAKKFKLESIKEVHDDIIKNRIIMNFNQNGVQMNQITGSIKSMVTEGNFSANVIVIDGYDFEKGSIEDLKQIRKMAESMGLEIWISASLKDEEIIFDEKGVPLPLKSYLDETDILIFIKPENNLIHLQLVKDHDVFPDSNMHLKLDPKSLLIVDDAE
ncbi:MAG: hypothetical protein JW864_00990 [Spirochaetes bacterium]|nr:hypothetical protein [Spirochaetota bacterium]